MQIQSTELQGQFINSSWTLELMSSVRSKSEHKHGGEEEEEERERPKPLPLPEPLDGGRPGLDNRASLEYVVMSLHRTATGTRTHAQARALSPSKRRRLLGFCGSPGRGDGEGKLS